jgi:hypothetical protein
LLAENSEECPTCEHPRYFCPSVPDKCEGCEDLFDNLPTREIPYTGTSGMKGMDR